jgi:hypothetical protein
MRGLGGLLTQGLEIGVLRLGIRRRGWEAVGADNLLGLWGRSRSSRLRDSDSRNGRSRQNLALRRGAVLGSNVDRAFVIRRILVHTLQLALQLTLAFLSSFKLGTLGLKSGLLLLSLTASFFPASLLFLLLDLALSDLLLKGA